MQISEALGRLPLALDQAGAYLEEVGCSLSDYQQLYQRHRATLLKERRGLLADHPEPVASTWSLSFARVEAASPAAADLLRLCAYLAPDAIAQEIITAGAAHLGPALAPVASDALLLGQAMEALRAYSLITRDPGGHSLSVHRLVQAVIKDSMDKQASLQWAERAVYAVNAAFPGVEFRTWPQCDQLLPHALVCAEIIEDGNLLFPEAGRLLTQAGWYLKERAQYDQATLLIRRGLEIREKVLGPEHLDVAKSLNNLALLYRSQDKYVEAEQMYMRSLAIRKQQVGVEHPDTATSLSNLAYLYKTQGKYEQAEPLYVRALSIYERQLGSAHPWTLSARRNYVSLLRIMGRDVEARVLEMKHMPPS